ncbi:MAG: CoA ester lyase [Sphingomonas sp.]|uniref:HpcH/HpaI aldolase/citrate lyase family protein n=1 Tax=Sphingomonas sp. TaxID=28214 RepID=UPI0025F59316|nr:CoA ester lyase [Sphingomonas sp.]MBX3563539.1 CoA ester lyase [Sphingomonas sp.]
MLGCPPEIDARTLLFVPGDRPERFSKARGSGAQAIVLDLEDAVLPAAKDAARHAVFDWLGQAKGSIVRINGAETPWFEHDIAAVAQSTASAIMLPKADADALHARSWPKPVIALIESAEGLATARVVAQHPDVKRLAFGALDFALDLDFIGPDTALDGFRLELVIASRLAGIAAPIDGVSVMIDDEASVFEDARRARSLGFAGKLCIHPRQLEAVSRAFHPSVEEIAWARQVVGTDTTRGAAKIEGTMIDEPVRRRAARILASL